MGKPTMVLISGWGFDTQVFDCWTEHLEEEFILYTFSWAQFLNNLAIDELPEKFIVAGWSLGGNFALEIACKLPCRVSHCITLATNAQFTEQSSWPNAMPQVTFGQFTVGMASHHSKMLRRFASLSGQGGLDEKAVTRYLQQQLKTADFSLTQLNQGLTKLQNLDCRPMIASIACPLLMLFGENDRLVPQEAAQPIQALNKACIIDIISQTGHAPFISHPELLTQKVRQFIQ